MTQPSALPLTHLHLPARRTTADKSPLLVLLHGFGSNEQDLFGLTPYLDERFMVISARAPLTMQPGSYAWYRIDWQPDGKVLMDDNQADAALDLLADFVRQAVVAYDADPAHVYVGGFSQGAIMSECLALTQPGLVAGAVLMSGRTLELARMRALTAGAAYPPMIVVHGTADQVLPVREGRATRDFLNTLGVTFDYREYPMAHQISDASLDDIDSWLSAQLDRTA